MKRLLWLGLFFLSTSWLFFIPQFTVPNLFNGAILVLLGTLCMIAGLWHNAVSHGKRTSIVLLVALIPALIIVPFPYSLGVLILASGTLLRIIFLRQKKRHAIPSGVTLAGMILIIQTLLFPFYKTFAAHAHRVDFLAGVLSPLANLFGLQTSTHSGLLFLQTVQQNYAVTITWEKLGFYVLLNLFLGAILLFFISSEKRMMLKHTAIFLLTSLLYLFIRFIGLLGLYQVTTDMSLFWDPFIVTLSFLPLAFLLMKLLPFEDMKLNHPVFDIPEFRMTKKHLFALMMMFLLIFSLGTIFLYRDPGLMKNGRVLIDEYHSQWEDSTRPLDTDWYGLLSTYNYYSWRQWLGYHYQVTVNINDTLTPQLLDDYDILILKCPTQSYSPQEVQSITSFVAAGGGLYLIGDHTNVFGMNTFLNHVSEEFGLRFKTDATYELESGNLTVYYPDAFFSHPVIRHIHRFDFMTSCSLEPTSFVSSLRMQSIIIGNRIIGEPGTYSTENFFRESMASTDSEFGYLLQAAAMPYGRGRVVAFTDSTVFSSFCMFTDGYPLFTLGVMDYLNRTNSSELLTAVLLCIIILAFVTLLFLLKKQEKIICLWVVLVTGLLAFSVAATLCFSFSEQTYQIPSAQQQYPSVYFDQQHSSYDISVKPTAAFGYNENNYATFFVWTQRLGCVPTLEGSLEDATTNSDVIVFINPNKPFTESNLQLVAHYLEKGGHVLLLDSIKNPQSTANELVGQFGLWIETKTDEKLVILNTSSQGNDSEVGTIVTPRLTVAGGTPLLVDENNETYAQATQFISQTTGAAGKLVVVVDSYMFSDAVMGGTFTEPSEKQRRIYATEFYLLDYIIHK